MPVDMWSTLKNDAEQAGWAIEVPNNKGGTMARRSFQQGSLFQRGPKKTLGGSLVGRRNAIGRHVEQVEAIRDCRHGR
jgi:hypothetical protein